MNIETRIDPATLTLEEEGDRLFAVREGERIEIGALIRCFPDTDPGRWVSLRRDDGSELGLLETLDGLDRDSRRIVELKLRQRYHVPVISRILDVDRSPEGVTTRVDTGDGEFDVLVRGERDVDTRAFPRVLLTDGETGRRYLIPDYTDLDRPSQALARQHLGIAARRGRRGFRR